LNRLIEVLEPKLVNVKFKKKIFRTGAAGWRCTLRFRFKCEPNPGQWNFNCSCHRHSTRRKLVEKGVPYRRCLRGTDHCVLIRAMDHWIYDLESKVTPKILHCNRTLILNEKAL
jgi:hypothetical protein